MATFTGGAGRWGCSNRGRCRRSGRGLLILRAPRRRTPSKRGRHKCRLYIWRWRVLDYWKWWQKTIFTIILTPLFPFPGSSASLSLISPSHSRHRYRVAEPPIVSAASEQGSGVINRVGRTGGGADTLLAGFHLHLLFPPRTASRFISAAAPGGAPNAPPKCSVWLRRRQKKLFYANSRSDIPLIKDGSRGDSIPLAWRTHFQQP